MSGCLSLSMWVGTFRMSAPVVAEVVASPPSPLEGASPPPRRLPGAAAVCNRDVLGALLKTATESSDVVSALGIEKQTILLCRDRQQLVVEIVQAEKRLAELIAESVKAKTEQAPAASVVRTVAQLVAAKAGAPDGRGAGKLAAGSAGELSGDVIAPKGVAATVGSQAPAPKARKVTWSWFSMLGREGRLIAGVTNGSGAWFVAEGERVPGAGLVKRISARPPVVEVAGVGMLGWVEGPPRPGEEKKGSEGLRRPEPVLGPVVEDALDRVVERVFGRGGGEGQAGGVLKGRADTIDGDTLRMTISAISVSAPVVGWTNMVSRSTMVRESDRTLSTPRLKLPASTAAAILDSIRVSRAANSVFCSSIGSARRRLRNCDIGGRSSLRPPSWVSLRPVASWKSCSDQPSMRPAWSAR